MDKSIVLACGREVKRIREVNTGSLDFVDNPIVLARVVLDTRFLNKPIVKIDFSTFIRVDTPAGDTFGAVFNLELRRNCDGVIEILRYYRYMISIRDIDIVGSRTFDLRDIFAFTFCDKDLVCHGECCTYTVELIRIDVLSEGTPDNVLTIEDSSIRAIAQGICNEA